MNPVPEKRSFTRKPLDSDVSFEMCVFEKEGQIKNIVNKGYGTDISSNGIGMILPCAVNKGDVMRLFLPANLSKAGSYVFAEVMWSCPEGTAYKTGLRFLFL